ncbi:facilitated trehalose transporter Tret1-2 homolog [Dermacentor silvarum]|uniref:facilitated trehalose transporter Tret1-2 homolog n=1 Tax=Dermacentor silvarum TaxID=543639 RepID=UPI001896C907|nr:facilitated trehalose transporter Tret1-2 homolog [Dermacentor silvarum]
MQVAISAGVLSAYTLAGFAWEQQAAGCAMASMPMLALQRYVIENPRWLMSKGLILNADTAVMRLYGVDPPADFRQRKAEGVQEQQMGPTSYRLWPTHARMVSACLLLHLLQNISGAQLCLLRAIQVMGNAVAEISPQLLAAMLVAAHLGHWSVREESSPTSWGAVISVGLLVLAYSVGLCHLPALLTGEIMPSRIRLLGSSVVWSSRWLVAFLLMHFDVDVLGAFQQRGPLLALSLTMVVVATTATLLIPETEGRTLTQINTGS